MTYYDTIVTIICGASLILHPLVAVASYQKGCSNTWQQADEMAQVKPILPLQEPQTQKMQDNPLLWPTMPFVRSCRECQDEEKQAL